MNMYFVYVLRSVDYGSRYVGSTDSVDKRLKEHNSGASKYTSGRRPWTLIHKEEFRTRSDAQQREKYLKTGQGRKWLDENLTS